MNLDDMLTAWGSYLRGRSGRTVSTLTVYRRHVDKALAWIGVDDDITGITLVELSNYIAFLEDRGWQDNSRRVAAVALRSFFAFAAGARWIDYNPAQTLAVPRGQRREVKTLTLSQVRSVIFDGPPALELSAMELRNRLIFGLSYHLGLRAHEVTWLRLDEVVIEGQETSVQIRASKHGTKDHRREIRHDGLASMLVIYLSHHRAETPGPWLFPSRQADARGPGGRLSVRQIQRIFYSELHRAGIKRRPGWRHHMLRASVTTHHLEAGADIHKVQAWVRHKAGATTLLYAEHVADRRLAEQLHSRHAFGPREHKDFRRALRQDLALDEPRARGSGLLFL